MPPPAGSPPPSAATRRAVQIQAYGMPRLYFALLRARFTGLLTLPQPDPAQPGSAQAPPPATRTVWIRGGMPVFTDWAAPEDVLGRVLLDSEALGPEALNQALTQMARDGGRLGELLVADGLLTPAARTEGLRLQCMRKLVRTFALAGGEATYEQVDHGLGQGDDLAPINVLELVRRGMTAHYSLERVRFEMGEAGVHPLALTPSFARYRDHFHLRPQDEPILQALARGATLLELCDTPGIDGDHAAQIMGTLWACQMLAAPGATQARPSPASARPTAPATRRPPAPPRQAAAAAQPPSTTPPAPAAPKGAAGDEAAFTDELARLEALLADEAHAFKLMGLDPSATRKDVRAAWRELSQRFHPDSLASRGWSHLRERVERVFASLSEANLLLGDKARREELRRLIEAGGTKIKSNQTATAMARAAIESEMIAKEADKLLAKGNMAAAAERYGRALALTPDEPDIRAAHLWASYHTGGRDKGSLPAAIATLEQISAEYPKVARAHYFRGLLLLEHGDDALAQAAFEQALQANPQLTDAARQARAIRLRRAPQKPQAAPQKKGLGRFFRR